MRENQSIKNKDANLNIISNTASINDSLFSSITNERVKLIQQITVRYFSSPHVKDNQLNHNLLVNAFSPGG